MPLDNYEFCRLTVCWQFFFLFFKAAQFSSVQFSCSVMSDSLRPHELQHARPPCPSPIPRVHSESRPPSQWCHPDISSHHPLLLLPLIPPSIRVFSNEPTLRMRWPKYWSFSFSMEDPNSHGLRSLKENNPIYNGIKKNKIPRYKAPVLWPPHAKSWLIGKASDAGRD